MSASFVSRDDPSCSVTLILILILTTVFLSFFSDYSYLASAELRYDRRARVCASASAPGTPPGPPPGPLSIPSAPAPIASPSPLRGRYWSPDPDRSILRLLLVRRRLRHKATMTPSDPNTVAVPCHANAACSSSLLPRPADEDHGASVARTYNTTTTAALPSNATGPLPLHISTSTVHIPYSTSRPPSAFILGLANQTMAPDLIVSYATDITLPSQITFPSNRPTAISADGDDLAALPTLIVSAPDLPSAPGRSTLTTVVVIAAPATMTAPLPSTPTSTASSTASSTPGSSGVSSPANPTLRNILIFAIGSLAILLS